MVDRHDKFINSVEKPVLSQVIPHFEDDKYLCLNAPGMETLKVDIELKAEKTEYKRIR